MKVAVDTNVLVRYLTWDDPVQSPLAAAALEAASTIVVSTIVLCEVVWVLRRSYKFGHQDIATIYESLFRTAGMEFDRVVAEAGMASLLQGGDFADGVILSEADLAKADRLLSFDRGFAATLNPGACICCPDL